MAGKVRVKMLTEGSRDLLRSREVERDIERRAEAMEAAAGDGFEARTIVGRKRVLGSVRATNWAAYRAESRGHALTRSMDAAR